MMVYSAKHKKMELEIKPITDTDKTKFAFGSPKHAHPTSNSMLKLHASFEFTIMK
jgi:hypothetical protein